jgi:hypothetical protein
LSVRYCISSLLGNQWIEQQIKKHLFVILNFLWTSNKQGNQCFVHMATDPSSSSHCTNDKQPEFNFILCTWQPTWVHVYTHDEKDKEKAIMQCITSKIQIFYVCFKFICTCIERKFKHLINFSFLTTWVNSCYWN